MAYDYIVETTSIEFGVLHLSLRPKDNSDHFPFAPGQYASLSYKRGGRPTPVRCFSIVSSPDQTTLQFGMRIHGNFTRGAARLQPGDSVKVDGPYGDFTFSQNDRQVVMMAGGIGVTPFIGMLRYATEARLPMNITLLYSNRSSDTAPFVEEIMELAAANPRLRVYFFNTGGETPPSPTPSVKFLGTSITQAHLERLANGAYAGSTYFICGPKGFMKSMQKGLKRNDVDESYIVTESFASAGKGSLLGGMSIQPMTYGLSAAAMIAMTGFIMFLDLSRVSAKTTDTQNTPAATATTTPAASTATTSTTVSTPTPTTTSTPSTSASSSSSSKSASGNSSSSSNSNSSSSNKTTYQPPVSSVS